MRSFGKFCENTPRLRFGRGPWLGPLLAVVFAGLSVQCSSLLGDRPIDTDGDLINDAQDACPRAAGFLTSDPRTNGCPPPPDLDHDGILDFADACPREIGEASDDASMNGCPDADHDDVVDHNDACPNLPGRRTADVHTNGCPDRDEDGVIDDQDACPMERGVLAASPQHNGCPVPSEAEPVSKSPQTTPGTTKARPPR